MKKLMDEKSICFIESILDGMQDWVRVIDMNDIIIYANQAMRKELGDQFIGKKCYEILGRSGPCDNCISKHAIRMYDTTYKEEEINGRIYSVRSSPLINSDGEVEACVEVLRDITQEKLMQQKIELQNQKLKSDLQIARMMQYSLLPEAGRLSNGRIEFTYTYMPCETIGGDFFDIYEIDSSHVGVYIADVSGHGVPASMLTMFFRQSINKRLLSPAQVLNELFEKFNEVKFNEEFYITMFYAVIDTESMEIKYSNAGHHTLPIIINEGKLNILNSAGIPISNWADNVKYEEHKINYASGDKIILYTDGVTEALDNRGKRYGELRFQEFILNNWGKHIEKLNNDILEDINNFKSQGKMQLNKIDDDLTVIIIEMK